MQPDGMRAGRFGLAGFVLLLCVGILLPFALWEGRLEEMSREALQQTSAGLRGMVVAGLLAVDVLLPIPSSLVMVAAAIVLPAVAAFFSCFAGLMLGSGLGYGMGRWLGEPLLKRMAGEERRSSLSAWFARHGVAVIAICRPVPMLAELSIVMAGSARTPLVPFFFASAAANAAVAATYVALGSQVSDSWTFLVAFAASCLVPALGWLVLRGLVKDHAADRR
jgi:membrane protein DedA with SNARE-associated domain